MGKPLVHRSIEPRRRIEPWNIVHSFDGDSLNGIEREEMEPKGAKLGIQRKGDRMAACE
jgi:hypothetical protein